MRAKTILLLLIALLFTFVVSAQTRYPKREFRGAWIQCVLSLIHIYNVAVLLNFKGNYVEHGMDETSIGAQGRYYFSSCGIYGGLGMAYKHLSLIHIYSGSPPRISGMILQKACGEIPLSMFLMACLLYTSVFREV